MKIDIRSHFFPRRKLFWNLKRWYSVMSKHKMDDITMDGIVSASQKIKPFIHKTPILTSQFANELSGRKLFFKCELFQKAGSFKIRGVTNAIARIKEERDGAPFTLVTHSSGNHGQAVAKAAAQHGLESIIVTPTIAPLSKKKAILGYGSKLVECDPSPIARQETADNLLKELGDQGEYVSSADHPFVIEGAGSAGVEMSEQVPDLDAIMVCCGQGGLLAGISQYYHETSPKTKIFAAEPELADDTAKSLREGRRIVYDTYPNTIADGLRMSVGVHTWPIIQKSVSDVVLVSDAEIVRAMYFLWERMKLLVEPSGAVAFAAVLSEQFRSLPESIQNIGITLSGGNMDLDKIPWVVNPDKYRIDL